MPGLWRFDEILGSSGGGRLAGLGMNSETSFLRLGGSGFGPFDKLFSDGAQLLDCPGADETVGDDEVTLEFGLAVSWT